MKTEIYLIRHAEPLKLDLSKIKSNDDKQVMNEKIPLSISGEEQAKNLSNLDELKNLDLVVSSNYVRAISTSKYLVDDSSKLIIDSSYNERKLGTENKNEEFWITQLYDKNAKTKDGESQQEVRDRMLKSIDNILLDKSIKRCAIVTHATAITFLLMNWCILEDANIIGKKRKLSFNDKVIINDSFKTPEVFKLVFNDKNIISIERINI